MPNFFLFDESVCFLEGGGAGAAKLLSMEGKEQPL